MDVAREGDRLEPGEMMTRGRDTEEGRGEMKGGDMEGVGRIDDGSVRGFGRGGT